MDRTYLVTYNGGKTFSALWKCENELKDAGSYSDFLVNVLAGAKKIWTDEDHDFGNWDMAHREFDDVEEFKRYSEKENKGFGGDTKATVDVGGENVTCSLSGPSEYSCARILAEGSEKGLTEFEKLIIKYAK